jgi:hypothetical protein
MDRIAFGFGRAHAGTQAGASQERYSARCGTRDGGIDEWPRRFPSCPRPPHWRYRVGGQSPEDKSADKTVALCRQAVEEEPHKDGRKSKKLAN